MADNPRRIDRILDAGYLADLAERSIDGLREMKAEATEVETEVSYVRRLAQARLDILAAERERRRRGGSLEDLVKDLPRILGADSTRAPVSQARVGELLAPSPDITWSRGDEPLIDDATLARLPDLTDDELTKAAAGLTELESEMSTRRRSLHAVIDKIEREIAARTAATSR